MQRKLHVFLIVLSCGFFTPFAFASYEYEDDYAYYNDSYNSYQTDREDSRYNYSRDDSYPEAPSNYANNYPDYYEDPYPEERHYRSKKQRAKSSHSSKKFDSRLASTISPPGEDVVIVDPKVHRWGAYNAEGNLLREGVTTAGSSWCGDLGRSCRTSVGTFRVWSLGDSDCKSRKFPLGRGGAPMPYCMFFNRTQALHGSYEVREANVSHGCVRLKVDDAEWLRFNFVRIGTKVIIKPYS